MENLNNLGLSKDDYSRDVYDFQISLYKRYPLERISASLLPNGVILYLTLKKKSYDKLRQYNMPMLTATGLAPLSKFSWRNYFAANYFLTPQTFLIIFVQSHSFMCQVKLFKRYDIDRKGSSLISALFLIIDGLKAL